MLYYFIFLISKNIGPLMTKREDGRWSLIGVVSSGYSCAKPKQVHSFFIHSSFIFHLFSFNIFHSLFIHSSFILHSFFIHFSFLFHSFFIHFFFFFFQPGIYHRVAKSSDWISYVTRFLRD